MGIVGWYFTCYIQHLLHFRNADITLTCVQCTSSCHFQFNQMFTFYEILVQAGVTLLDDYNQRLMFSSFMSTLI